MVEKWPLIQAFALDGIGRGSFFTMKYKVGEADGARPSVRPSHAGVCFPADGHEREAVAGLQQAGPGVSEPGHHRGSSASPAARKLHEQRGS